MRLDFISAAHEAAELEQLIKPIARRPVDVNDPNWVAKIASGPHPLDQAGVRDRAEKLLVQLLESYACGSSGDRATIRSIFKRNHSFVWASGVPEKPTTAQGFRKYLLRLSAENGGGDMRDTIMAVNELCERASDAGVDIESVLTEVAELSDTAIVHGMKSMRNVLLEARTRHAKPAR